MPVKCSFCFSAEAGKLGIILASLAASSQIAHTKLIPTSGPLHWLFPLPGICFSWIFTWLTYFRSLLKWPILRQDFLNHFSKLASLSHSSSFTFLPKTLTWYHIILCYVMLILGVFLIYCLSPWLWGQEHGLLSFLRYPQHLKQGLEHYRHSILVESINVNSRIPSFLPRLRTDCRFHSFIHSRFIYWAPAVCQGLSGCWEYYSG